MSSSALAGGFGVSLYEIATDAGSVASLKRYLFWVFSWVPVLSFVSPAYRQGQGWTTHLLVVGLLPPVCFVGIPSLGINTQSPYTCLSLTIYTSSPPLRASHLPAILSLCYITHELPISNWRYSNKTRGLMHNENLMKMELMEFHSIL